MATNYSFDDNSDETNISSSLSQLNQKECELISNLLNKSNFCNNELKSQEEKMIIEITKKNLKHISSMNIEEINTQQFMDLNLDRAIQQLQSSQIYTGNNKPIESMDSDDLIVKSSPVFNILKDSTHNSKNSLNINKFDSEKYNKNTICTANFEVFNKVHHSIPTNQTQNSEFLNENSNLSNQDQDSEIITFQAMCEEMLKIKPIITNDGIRVNNKMIGFKQVNDDILSCVSLTNCVPNNSQLNSTNNSISTENINHVSNNVACKKRNFQCVTSYLPGKLLQEPSENQKKKIKLTTSQNLPKLHSRTSNRINLIVVTSSEDEDSCVLIENELPNVKNRMEICNRKQVFVDLLEENECLVEVKPIFTCSPNGQIHKDMLDYFNHRLYR